MESLLIGNGVRVNGRDYEIVGVSGGDVYSDGGLTVWDVFNTSPYTYLEISRGGVTGNVIAGSYSAEGIFKLRGGMIQGQNSEQSEQGATLHVKPSESFLTNVPTNREFYRLTLEPTDWSDFEESS